MALKTEWQKRQEVAGKRKYNRWDWLRYGEPGRKSRRVAYRKALYIMGYTVNYPFRKK